MGVSSHNLGPTFLSFLYEVNISNDAIKVCSTLVSHRHERRLIIALIKSTYEIMTSADLRAY